MTVPAGDRLSLVVPFWNEEETVQPMIDVARGALDDLVADGQLDDYEIVCVDDAVHRHHREAARRARCPVIRGSRPCTTREIADSAARCARVWAQRVGDLVLYTDADLPFDLRETGRLLHIVRMYQADVLSGYRLDRRSEGFRRTLYSAIYNLLIRFSLGLRVRDVNFACKVLRRSVVDAVELESEGSFIDAELMARADRMGFRIVQVGLDYFPRSRGVSTLSSWSTIVAILREWRGAGARHPASGSAWHRDKPLILHSVV